MAVLQVGDWCVKRRALGVIGAFAVALGSPATAQSVPPPSGPAFACDGNIYQVQSGQLRIFDPITSTYQNVGPQNGSYNATGYNILDNYAYASQGNNIIRLSADGTIETLFNVGFSTFSGDIDFNNGFWLRRNNNRYDRYDVTVDVGSQTPQVINFSGPGGGVADVAYVLDAGQEYLIGFGGGRIYFYNITTGVKTRATVPGLPGGGFGATWTDATGRLFTFNNNNGLLYEAFGYRPSDPTPLSLVQVGVGVPSGNNDGFSCSQASFPNLAPLAQDDAFTTPLNTPISGNVISDNGNGTDNDPEGGPITVTTPQLLGPANGTLALASDGSFTYTPNTNFIGTDTFEYEIQDETGLTATAVVTIDVTGTIDFTLAKTQTGGPATVTAAGQTLTYEIVLENTGDIDLTGVSVADTLPDGAAASLTAPVETGGSAPLTTGVLDVGETWTYTFSYTVTQADMDAGLALTNAVAASTNETALPKSDTAVTPLTSTASYTFDKAVDVASLSAPGTLSYTITVSNTGTRTLTGVALIDTLTQNGASLALTTGPSLAGDTDGDGALDVGETWIYSASFDAGQAEINNGADLVNAAEFTTSEAGTQSDTATTTITQSPSLSVSKVADAATLSAPGTLSYSVTVANTGNVDLTTPTLTDTLTQGAMILTPTTAPALLSGDSDGDGILSVGETWVYGLTYAVTQANIDDGAQIVNQASVATDQGAGGSDSATTSLTQSPSFTIDKSVDMAALAAPGTLSYTVVLANTGNVSLTSGVFTDVVQQSASTLPLTTGPTLSGDGDSDGVLDVGETWIYSANLAVGQSEIDDGADIVNTATFTPNEVAGQSDTATTTLTQTPSLALVKAISTGQPSSFDSVGDTIAFTFTITNTGNTTQTAPITITDDQIGSGLACATSDLAPGASTTCAHVWTADQSDLDAGSVTNTATAQSASGSVSPAQQATVTAVQSPALSIVKSIVAPVPTVFAAGEVLSYEYLVTNAGNVSFTQPVTVSDNLTTVTCPALPGGDLIPGEQIICTATYTLTANDELLGSTTNVASASSSFGGAPVTSPADSAIFPVAAVPVLEVEKVAVPAGLSVASVGETITYRFTVTNQPPTVGPGAALTEQIFINDTKFAAPILCRDPAVEGGSFLPGQSHVCEATYTVTQADLDAGSVENEATASTIFAPASPSPINVVSEPANETVAVAAAPALSLSKTVTSSAAAKAVGEAITYQIVAENTGNQTISNVMISDPLLGALSCDLAAPVTLAPSASLTCSGSYTVQQSDIDGQSVGVASTASIENTANVAGNDPAGAALPVVTASAPQDLAAAAPAVTIAKALFPNPSLDPAYMNVGDIVTYRMTVTNTGNMTLSSVDVTDSLVPGVCSVGPLAPGAMDTTCSFTYTVTQADIDAGQLANIGSASAQPIDSAASPVTDSDTLVSNGPAFDPELTVLKGASFALGSDGVATPGDLISYTITVQNTGNVTLSDVSVADPTVDPGALSYAALDDPDGDGDINALAPGAIATVTATHSITQAEIDAGSVSNSASATGRTPSGGSVSDTSDSTIPGDGAGGDDPTMTSLPRGPSFTVTKTPSQLVGAGVGDTIAYSYAIENTGNVTLTNIALSDAHKSAAGTANLTISGGGAVASLAPGAIATLSASYTVTQADVDAGGALTNLASATADGPSGTGSVSGSDNASVAVEAAAPSLVATKVVQSQSGSAAGDTITFQIDLRNSGNVSLFGVSLNDNLARLDGKSLPSPTPLWNAVDTGQAGVLDVGETWVYSVTHVLTQEDIDAGGISNSVQASANAPDGDTVTDSSDINGAGTAPTTVPIPAAPGLETVKQITSSGTSLGDTVTFEITLRNTGNVTLSSVGIASDTLTRNDGSVIALSAGPSFVGASLASPDGTLQVGETATYIASRVLTQDDINAGGITNTATGQGTPPLGAPITDVSDDTGAGSDPTVLTIAPVPSIALDKRLAASSPVSFDAPGQVLSFEFEVTNTGNITITDAVTIIDPLIPTGITCPSGALNPGASHICTGNYAVTQADIDAGGISNTATAAAGSVLSPADTTSVPAVLSPALSLVKSAGTVLAGDFVTGAVVTYTYTLTNTGNTTITSPISVSDNLIPASDIACDPFPGAGLAPGATYICTGTYTVTGDDVDLGAVTNLASATDGTTTSPLAAETVPETGVPSLSVTKSLVRSLQPDLSDSGTLTFDEVGDVLEYEFTVTNDGQRAFAQPVTIIDDRLAAPVTCFTPTGADPDFTPGESATCTGQYTVTQADLDAGDVVNQAFAETTFGAGANTVASPPDSVTTLGLLSPELTVAKSASPSAYSSLGQTVTYSIDVTNTGNQTVTNVSATDPLLPGLTCEATSLAPGDVLSCAAPYTITQADIDRGSLTNTASATGIDPSGAATPPASASVTSNGPSVAPTIALTKSASPDPFGAVGTTVAYTFTVENTSIYTLSNISVTDPLGSNVLTPPFSCSVTDLGPGQSDSLCVFIYTVTQEDVNAGQILNSATVSSEDPFGNPATTTATATTTGPPRVPGLDVTKLASFASTQVGETITYTLVVENTGNVSLGAISLGDAFQRLDGTPLALSSPFTLLTNDTDSNGQLQSGDLNGNGRIDPTETWKYEANYTLVQADLDGGGIENSATVSAIAPDGTTVSDQSDDGDDGDGNVSDDPTRIDITTLPELNVTKVVQTAPTAPVAAGDNVVFLITAANVGNVTAFNVSAPLDQLTRADGTNITSGITSIVQVDSGGAPVAVVGGDLAPGTERYWQVSYALTQDDINAGGVSNTATVTAEDAGGTLFSDASDDGDDGDGNITDDPTDLAISPAPELTVLKSLVSPASVTQAGTLLTFEVTAENTGNVTLSGLTGTDTLTNLDGTALSPTFAGVTGLTGGALEPGQQAVLTYTYTLTQADVDAGGVSNSASVSGTSPLGAVIADTSDNDGTGDSDPTVVSVLPAPSADLLKTASVPTRRGPDLFAVTFTLTFENTGNVTLQNLLVQDDLQAFAAPATMQSAVVTSVSGMAAATANPSYDGVLDTNTLAAGSAIAPGEVGVVVIDMTYDTSSGAPGGTNTFTVASDELASTQASVSVVTDVTPPDILATKSVSPSTARRGDILTYTVTFQNPLPTAEGGLRLVDVLPAGLAYIDGSATFDGVSVPQPQRVDRELRWDGVTLAANSSIVITYSARLISGPGEYVNRAFALGPSGARVSNEASATVTVAPEAVFDCAEVIGKVWDDRNGDGVQQAPDRSAVTDQEIFAGKEKPAVLDAEETLGEPGIAGARVVTTRGTTITTDAFGRFNVPCAELPTAIGSNFILKLDPRSLPTGYRVLSENPRVIRLTAGKMARLNFAVGIANVIDLDLTATAFDGDAPHPDLYRALRGLLQQLDPSDPFVLRVTYLREDEPQSRVRARLARVEDLMGELWNGDLPLSVERQIVVQK